MPCSRKHPTAPPIEGFGLSLTIPLEIPNYIVHTLKKLGFFETPSTMELPITPP